MSKLLALLLLGAGLSAASPIVYSMDNPVGAGNISGTIETDGTIGTLSAVNIVDWNLVLNDGSTTFTLQGPLSGNNSGLFLSGSDLTGTLTQLTFNFSGSSTVLFQSPAPGSGIDYFCLETDTTCTPSPAGEDLNIASGDQFTPMSGVQVIAVDPVPEPSTLGLLGLGTVALALFRRKSIQR